MAAGPGREGGEVGADVALGAKSPGVNLAVDEVHLPVLEPLVDKGPVLVAPPGQDPEVVDELVDQLRGLVEHAGSVGRRGRVGGGGKLVDGSDHADTTLLGGRRPGAILEPVGGARLFEAGFWIAVKLYSFTKPFVGISFFKEVGR